MERELQCMMAENNSVDSENWNKQFHHLLAYITEMSEETPMEMGTRGKIALLVNRKTEDSSTR
jgi:hypothetical protein